MRNKLEINELTKDYKLIQLQKSICKMERIFKNEDFRKNFWYGLWEYFDEKEIFLMEINCWARKNSKIYEQNFES